MTAVTRVPVHTDERGELVAVDFDEVPFDVRRVFLVSGVPAGVSRGGHRAGCRELLVLVRGSAWLDLAGTRVRLDQPGDAWLLDPEDHITYGFGDTDGVLMVLADEPYRPRDEA